MNKTAKLARPQSSVSRATKAPSITVYTPKTKLFDARPDRVDFRDLPYRAPLRSLPAVWPSEAVVAKHLPAYVAAGLILNQGSEGACTGFGLACVANYLLWTRHVESGGGSSFEPVSPRMFYELAKRYDEWPGDDYDGSSCRGALKGWQKHGVCSSTSWPYTLDKLGNAKFVQPRPEWQTDAGRRPLGVYYRVDTHSVVELQAAIVNIGAVYVSGDVHDGWDALVVSGEPTVPSSHGALPRIGAPKNPKDLGGHSFALVGFNERGFVVQNSWGVSWGASGFGVLPYEDWVAHGTDAWACALGVEVMRAGASAAVGGAGASAGAASRPATGHAARRVGRSGGSAAAVALDGNDHGVDAALQPVASSRWRVAPGRSLHSWHAAGEVAQGNPVDDPWPAEHPVLPGQAEAPWSTNEAYAHTLVIGHGGDLVSTDFTRDAADKAGLARDLVLTSARDWFMAQPGKTARLVVIADGGLRGESDAVQQTRLIGPGFEAEGAYPLFLSRRSGVGDQLEELTAGWARKLFGDDGASSSAYPAGPPRMTASMVDARARAMEATARVMGKGLWGEMKAGAAASLDKGRALDLLLRNVLSLQTALKAKGKRLELHVVGHSTGALLVGHLLTGLTAANAKVAVAANRLRVRSCTLIAPACSVRFAMEHFVPAAKARTLSLKRVVIHVLGDALEKRDGLPSQGVAAYGKSLLILASRALEDVRKTPMLGMERAHLPEYAHDFDQWAAGELAQVQAWQRAWGGRAGVAADGRLGVVGKRRNRSV